MDYVLAIAAFTGIGAVFMFLWEISKKSYWFSFVPASLIVSFLASTLGFYEFEVVKWLEYAVGFSAVYLLIRGYELFAKQEGLSDYKDTKKRYDELINKLELTEREIEIKNNLEKDLIKYRIYEFK